MYNEENHKNQLDISKKLGLKKELLSLK